MQDLSFEDWTKAVDKQIRKRCWLSSDDLPDVDYRGMYESGMSPKETAIFAIRNAADMDTNDESEPFGD